MSLNPKPYAHDLDDLPPPMAVRPSHPLLDNLSGPIWLATGMLLTALTLGIPGCMATGGPTVSAKADVSVKEVSRVVAVGGGAGGQQGGTGELSANVSIALTWPSK